MTKHFANRGSFLLRLALPLTGALALGACSAPGMIDPYENTYVSQVHWESYPIEVGKGTMKMEVPTTSAHLSPTQEETVVRFAQQARRTEASQVVVSSPTGGAHAGAVAGKVADLLASEGIPPRAIVNATYQGGRTAPVVVSFARHFASSPECGDWSQSITETGYNEAYANFGCAQQHNIAALVADPQDIVVPRVSTPPDAMRRSQVLTDYRTPRDTSTSVDDAVVISDAIGQ
jgi:pilus assembly protein CpaD